MICEESLPLKNVEYSSLFIGFREFKNSKIYFCSCMYEAIKNYVVMRKIDAEYNLKHNRKSYLNYKEYNQERAFILNTNHFPSDIVKKLIEKNTKEDISIINKLNFKDKICHKCNKVVPSNRYCHPMYGGKFKQKYGWYIEAKKYELGLKDNYTFIDIDLAPEEIIEIKESTYEDLYEDLLEFYKKEIKFLPYFYELLQYLENQYNVNNQGKNRKEFLYFNKFLVIKFFQENFFTDSIIIEGLCLECVPNIGNGFKPHVYYGQECYVYQSLIEKAIDKKIRKIKKIVENEVRNEVGVNKIGEGWTSETILYTIVKKIYEGHEIIRHYRPSILEHLELDIYIKDLDIGIEYQGIQHFKPVKHWGGKETFKKTKERDKKKKDLCEKNGIKLIYFYHDDELSENLVKQRISEN